MVGTEQDRRRGASRGFTLVELIVVIAIIGILAGVALPFLLSYYQTSKVRAAAQTMTTFLNQGRQLAIRTNQNVCVHITPTAMHYHLGSCTGPTWVGPGSDAVGNVNAPAAITLTTTADPVFNYVGAATPQATYTVTSVPDGHTLSVLVTTAGRITIGP